MEQEAPILKAKKQNFTRIKPQKNFKITPLVCNQTGQLGASPFLGDTMKSKKLLNFTEKANEVISERHRMPRKQNLQLLKMKLLNDEDDEQAVDENESYLDE